MAARRLCRAERLSGWLVGQIACLPVNLIVAVRDTEGQAKLFVETLLLRLAGMGRSGR